MNTTRKETETLIKMTKLKYSIVTCYGDPRAQLLRLLEMLRESRLSERAGIRDNSKSIILELIDYLERPGFNKTNEHYNNLLYELLDSVKISYNGSLTQSRNTRILEDLSEALHFQLKRFNKENLEDKYCFKALMKIRDELIEFYSDLDNHGIKDRPTHYDHLVGLMIEYRLMCKVEHSSTSSSILSKQ